MWIWLLNLLIVFWFKKQVDRSIEDDLRSQQAIGPHECNITPGWIFALRWILQLILVAVILINILIVGGGVILFLVK